MDAIGWAHPQNRRSIRFLLGLLEVRSCKSFHSPFATFKQVFLILFHLLFIGDNLSSLCKPSGISAPSLRKISI